MTISQNTTYLFVDGRNFRTYFDLITTQWFGKEVEFDLNRIRQSFSPVPEKIFFYDCLDDVRSDNESTTTFEDRVSEQEQRFKKLREVEGCHVQLGSLTGKGKKKRQKEVDVLLATQVLEHAFRGNMKRVVLLSGDRDFRPVVETLVRFGLFVEVVADKFHFSSELVGAADRHKVLTIDEYFNWTSPLYRDEVHGIQRLSFFPERAESEGFALVRKGNWNSSEISVYQKNDRPNDGLWLYSEALSKNIKTAFAIFPPHQNSHLVKLLGNDPSTGMFERLSLFFELTHGKIDWNLK